MVLKASIEPPEKRPKKGGKKPWKQAKKSPLFFVRTSLFFSEKKFSYCGLRPVMKSSRLLLVSSQQLLKVAG